MLQIESQTNDPSVENRPGYGVALCKHLLKSKMGHKQRVLALKAPRGPGSRCHCSGPDSGRFHCGQYDPICKQSPRGRRTACTEKSPRRQGAHITAMSWDTPGTLLHADVILWAGFITHPSRQRSAIFESCDITEANIA